MIPTILLKVQVCVTQMIRNRVRMEILHRDVAKCFVLLALIERNYKDISFNLNMILSSSSLWTADESIRLNTLRRIHVLVNEQRQKHFRYFISPNVEATSETFWLVIAGRIINNINNSSLLFRCLSVNDTSSPEHTQLNGIQPSLNLLISSVFILLWHVNTSPGCWRVAATFTSVWVSSFVPSLSIN